MRGGKLMKRDGIRDKADKSRVIYFSFITLSYQLHGEREDWGVEEVLGGEGAKGSKTRMTSFFFISFFIR